MSHYTHMNTPTEHYLERLRTHHGTYAKVAQAIGIDPRTLAKDRRATLSQRTEIAIRIAGSLLELRMIIQELVQSGALDTSTIEQVRQKIQTR